MIAAFPIARGEVAAAASDSAEGLPDRSAQDPEAEFLPTLLLHAATNIGSLLCDGIGDAILVQGEHGPGQALRLSYNILQAAGSRIFKTDYVACPSCGRTLVQSANHHRADQSGNRCT